MRRLRRLSLSAKTIRFLGQRSERVSQATDSQAEARKLWRSKNNQAFREIKATLAEMAPGRERYMYCEDSQGTDIEHFHPKTTYPEKAFEWENYLLACSHCNSNEKRDQFPLDDDDRPLLIDPTREDPLDHLALSPRTGKYRPRGPKGQPSIEVFGLARAILEGGRKDAWTALEVLLVRYGRLSNANEHDQAARIAGTVQKYPFSGVFAYMLHIVDGPGAELVDAACREAIEGHPEIRTWLDT